MRAYFCDRNIVNNSKNSSNKHIYLVLHFPHVKCSATLPQYYNTIIQPAKFKITVSFSPMS
jgi:hypothetical protein